MPSHIQHGTKILTEFFPQKIRQNWSFRSKYILTRFHQKIFLSISSVKNCLSKFQFRPTFFNRSISVKIRVWPKFKKHSVKIFITMDFFQQCILSFLSHYSYYDLLVNHGAQLGQRRIVLEKTILYALGNLNLAIEWVN